MGITDFVSRLTKIRQTGIGRFIACCPAHEDKSPSMAIHELPDGRILIHCFAGCEPQAILDAVGMKFSDLFPEPLTREHLPRVSRPFSAEEALECLRTESMVVAICSVTLAEGKRLDPTDQARFDVAVGRIATALEVTHG